MNKIKALGICGLARCGKDTFYSIAKDTLSNMGYRPVRVTFAEALRMDVHDFLLSKTGIDAFTEVTEEKNIIRDFLVAYGSKLMRRINERCWIEKVEPYVKERIAQGELVVFTDVRYPNELSWIQNSLEGLALHISRVNNLPPNNEEAQNDPLLSAEANMKFRWDNFIDEQPSGQNIYEVKQTISHLMQQEVCA